MFPFTLIPIQENCHWSFLVPKGIVGAVYSRKSVDSASSDPNLLTVNAIVRDGEVHDFFFKLNSIDQSSRYLSSSI